MQFINRNIKWVMLVSGVLTCTMFMAVISPELALKSTFGASLEGALAEVVVRSWGALVTLVGAMLIYGAFRPVHRNLVLVVATVSKLFFIGLVVTIGNQFLGKAGLTIAFDSVVVIIFAIYLLSPQDKPEGGATRGTG